MITEEFSFPSPAGHKLAATNVLNIDGDPPAALLLHGMHESGRQLYTRLALQLAERGIGSLRFDQSGWGDSPGDQNTQTLSNCLGNARTALRQFDQGRAPIVIGHSMGGHIAARLLEMTRPDLLVLFCPAAYPADGEATPFGNGISGDFHTSLGIAHLQGYTGRVLLVSGSEDELIPPGVFDLYEQACTGCSKFDHIILEGAPHGLQGWLQQPENSAIRQQILDRIAEFVI